MLAYIPTNEYDPEAEQEYRTDVERRLKRAYSKNANLIVPFGYELGFTGEDGSKVALNYAGGSFNIKVDDVTLVALATDAALLALQSAYQSADASLSASISSEATTRATADSALASSITSLTAAYQAADTTLQANITSEASTRASADTAIASSVTTLTATVATNTANISTNATAIATVDGKLTASYGITVDVNGRIAGLKLLSNGSTSSIEFTASTFKVYNGTTTETPFEISGGVVKIKTANVGVLTAANISVANLAALSADLGTITAGQLNLTSGSYVVRHGAGFGASSDLVMWYGLSSIAQGSATKTNGVFALATDGKVYYGALAVVAPITMSFSPSSVSYSAAGAGGQSNAITVTPSGGTGSYTYQWYVAIFAYSGASTLKISSGGTSSTCTVAGTFPSGGDISGRLYCIVTDSDGNQATSSIAVSYSSTS